MNAVAASLALPDPRFAKPLVRRSEARPRREEQCLPQEGATPQRDAGAMKRGRGIPCAARSPLRGVPRATLQGALSQGVANNAALRHKNRQSTL
jgi:hypothetical protein